MFQDRLRSNPANAFAYKPADETVTDSSVLQADDDLVVPVLSNRKYAFKALLHMDASDSGIGLKYSVSGPANNYFYANSITNHSTGFTRETPMTALDQTIDIATAPTDQFVMIEGSIEPSASGSLSINWACHTVPGTRTMKRGSHLFVWRIG